MTAREIYSPEPARGWLPWGILAPFLCLVFVVAPAIGGSIVLEQFQLADAKGDPIGLVGLAAFLVFPFAAMAVAVVAWVLLVERRSLVTIGLGAVGAVKFVPGHLIGLATICSVVGAIWAAGGYEVGGFGKALAAQGAIASVALLLVSFVVQASAEEIVFRGWFLSALTRRLGIVVAMLLTSAVFSLVHYGPGQLWLVTLNTFLFSVFTCCWVLREGGIWGVMGWHVGWNWLSAVGFELPITGLDANVPALIVELTARGPDHLTGGAQGPEGSVFCTIFFVASSIALLGSRAGDARRAQ